MKKGQVNGGEPQVGSLLNNDVVHFPNGMAYPNNPSEFKSEGDWEQFVGTVSEGSQFLTEKKPIGLMEGAGGNIMNVAIMENGSFFSSPEDKYFHEGYIQEDASSQSNMGEVLTVAEVFGSRMDY